MNCASRIWKKLVATSAQLVFLVPALGLDQPSDLRSIVSGIDCKKCMSQGQACDSEIWKTPFDAQKRISVAFVKKPHLEELLVDHACGEKLIHEECTSYRNLALYSFSNVRYIVNKSSLPENVVLSASFDTRQDDQLASGIRLSEAHSYLIVSFGRGNGWDRHKSIYLACELSN